MLAVDYGARAVGLAISDELQISVRPLATLRVAGLKRSAIIERIAEAAREYEVEAVVIGLPLRLDGTRGDAAARIEAVASELQSRISAPVIAWDERLTSRAADERLRERGMGRRERRARSDETAAVIILEDYLAESERRRLSGARTSLDAIDS